MQEQHRWLRSAGAMAGITLLSRITGYLRDLLQGYVLGAGPGSDAFVIAYRIPNLFRRLVGEGEMTAAFVPVFTRYLQGKDREEVWRFCGAAFYALSLVLVLIVLAGVIFAPLLVGLLASGFGADPGKWELTVALNRVMFPYLLCISLSALSMAILNSLGSFAYPALSPILLNLSIGAAALLLAPRMREPAFGFAVGVLAGGVLQFLYQVPVLARRGMDFTPRLEPGHPGVRMVGRLMLPGLFGAGVTQLNLVIDSQFASWLQPGSVSFLYYAVRVTELALGVFAVPVSTAVLPRLSAQAARGDAEAVRQTLAQAARLLGFITLPATVGLVLLRQEIVAVLFQRGRFGAADTVLTADALLYYSLGLVCYAGVKVFAPSFYAYQDTVTPVQVGVIVFLVHLGLNFLLIRPLRHGGLALSTSLSAALN
ncbi:MAG: murein biosynthesis integral membrane protein MurJ, partial [Acidobacteria bacterium]|nr:murein biosynthesis integral membrane protein MurJ [Acidobacteriota bacterium]